MALVAGSSVCYTWPATKYRPGAVRAAPATSQRRIRPMTNPDCSEHGQQVKACSKCGEVKPLASGFHREGYGYRGVCRDCRNAARRARHVRVERRYNPNDAGRDDAKRCAACGVVKPLVDFAPHALGFLGRHSRCRVCGRIATRKSKAKLKARPKDIPDTKVCGRCGATKPAAKFNRYCYSTDGLFHYCRTCEDNKLAEYRARRAAVSVEDVDRAVVWARDGGRCHICGKLCDPDRWHLDHLVPLSVGGEHSYRNVAVSHPSCNIRRGVRGAAQMRLGVTHASD